MALSQHSSLWIMACLEIQAALSSLDTQNPEQILEEVNPFSVKYP